MEQILTGRTELTVPKLVCWKMTVQELKPQTIAYRQFTRTERGRFAIAKEIELGNLEIGSTYFFQVIPGKFESTIVDYIKI